MKFISVIGIALGFLLISVNTDASSQSLPIFSKELDSAFIDYSKYKNDSILKLFLNKVGLDSVRKAFSDSKNKVIMNLEFIAISKEKIKEMSDSLYRNGCSFKIVKSSFVSRFKDSLGYRKSKAISSQDIFHQQGFTIVYSRTASQTDRPLAYFYLGRTYDLKSMEYIIEFTILEADAPSPPFEADSIGHFNSTSISFDKVDKYIESLSNYDTLKLAETLAAPFKTDLEKVRSIYMWIVKNIKYDYEGLKSGNMIVEYPDVLKYRKGVCAGYSSLFSYLCDKISIKNSYIIGEAANGEGHAWNMVRIDSKWYLLDVTWGEKYFLMEPTEFVKKHFPKIKRDALLPYLPKFK